MRKYKYKPGQMGWTTGKAALLAGILILAAILIGGSSANAAYVETSFSDVENNTAIAWPNTPYEIGLNTSAQINVCTGSLNSDTGDLSLTCHSDGNITMSVDRPLPVKADVVGADLYHQYGIILMIFTMANFVCLLTLVFMTLLRR